MPDPDEETDVSNAAKPADTRAPETIESEIEATRDRLAQDRAMRDMRGFLKGIDSTVVRDKDRV